MEYRRKLGNKILWVETWIEKVDPNKRDYEVEAKELPNGKWKCIIELPLINKTISSISSTEINAMINASNKASQQIDEYMAEHKELEIKNEFKRKPYLIKTDENGRYHGIGLSSKHRAIVGRKMIDYDR